MCVSGEVQANLGHPPESVKLQGWVPGWPSALMRLILYFCDVPENQKITLTVDNPILMSLFLSLSLPLSQQAWCVECQQEICFGSHTPFLELLHSAVIPSFGLVIFVNGHLYNRLRCETSKHGVNHSCLFPTRQSTWNAARAQRKRRARSWTHSCYTSKSSSFLQHWVSF